MTHVKFNSRPFDKSINTMVDELINGFPVLVNDGFSSLSKQGLVPVNIKENNESYSLEVVAPGFEKADFKVKLDDKILTVSAERQGEEKSEIEKQIRREYNYRSFKRSFTIDEKIDATGIEASYVNGVLILNFPKKAEVKQTAKDIIIK
ncbi:MAG: Hsp20/alpha crystallin family protein [Chitinophagaceae bacterium]|nr:MAG: Hsp20/alpha crystallin family protein [Chitinophagaceae bacterium]